MGHITPIQQRLNITFGKFDALRYTSTLDLAKVWERVLRRADLPILYTEGFNTRPRIQLATALPLGISSECEIVDVALREVLPTLDGLKDRIESVSPDGLKVFAIESVDVNAPALQALVESAEYRIRFEDQADREGLQDRVDRILKAERIIKIQERKRGKRKTTSFDMRPMIHDLRVDENGDLLAHITTGEKGNLRPSELLEELGLPDAYVSVHRYVLHIDDYYRRLSERHS